MKRNLLYSAVLVICCLFGQAQYTDLYHFDDLNGENSSSGLYSDGTYLYGTTTDGGVNGDGVIFRIMPDGTGFQKLFDFIYETGRIGIGTLISDGTFLYGMTGGGGLLNRGVVYRIKLDGSEYETLHLFNDVDGLYPSGGVISDGTWLYGAVQRGGDTSDGVIFRIKPDGADFEVLHHFDEVNGKYPWGDLLLVDGFLYGTTEVGGTTDYGVIFKIAIDGTGFEKLMDFDEPTTGGQSHDGFIYDGTWLYGFTYVGGLNHTGTIYKIKPDGSDYTKLFDFENVDTGRSPRGVPVLVGSTLYGSTEYGGIDDYGTIFRIQTDGTGFEKLQDLVLDVTGLHPQRSPIYDGTYFYGTTNGGGDFSKGTVFKFQPQDISVNEIAEVSFSICPNPVNSRATISAKQPLHNARINVYNQYGQVVKQLNNVSGNNIMIDCAGLAAGVYMTEVCEGEGRRMCRMVVE